MPFATTRRLPPIAATISRVTGMPEALAVAAALIVAWLSIGPFLNFGSTWQFVFGTATTIVTFLMVFVIQDTQSRMMTVMHVKLDELIRATASARNELLNIEKLTQKELEILLNQYENLAKGEKSANLEALHAVEAACLETQTVTP